MKIKSFEHLRKQGASDREMMRIIRYKIIPTWNMSFDELVLYHGIKFIHKNKLFDYPVWEVYLNVLMREYQVPKNEIEDIIKTAIND